MQCIAKVVLVDVSGDVHVADRKARVERMMRKIKPATVKIVTQALSDIQGEFKLGCFRKSLPQAEVVGEGKPVTDMYLGLHVGEVYYGNIGSWERLDFTVIGPAVNEASRIAAMCRSVDQPVLISSAFADVGDIKGRLVSVGRYALRGVSQAQELFTLDHDADVS